MSESYQVISKDGRRGQIIAGPQEGSRTVTVRFESGQTAVVPIGLLEPAAAGSYRIAASLAELERSAADQGGGRIVIPAVEESVEVERRRVPGDTLRVHKRISERDELIDEPILHDEVQIERIPVGQVVSTAPEVRREGDVVIIPVIEEVLVIEKRLMLKEEVHIRRRRVEERHQDHVRLRKEEVVVERIPPEDEPGRD